MSSLEVAKPILIRPTYMSVWLWLMCISFNYETVGTVNLGVTHFSYDGSSTDSTMHASIFGLRYFEFGTATIVDHRAKNMSGRLHSTFPDTSTDYSDQVTISIRSRNTELTVLANRQKADYKFGLNIVGDKKTSPKEKSPGDIRNTFVSGYVKGNLGSRVYGKMHGGAFDGILYIYGDTLYVETAGKYFPNSSLSHVIIYREKDVINPYTKTKSIHSENNKNPRRTKLLRKKRSAPDKMKNRSCGVHVVADHTFYHSVGKSSIDETLGNILLQMSATNEIFTGTDFSGDGHADNIGVHIDNVTIYESYWSHGNILPAASFRPIDVASVMNKFNKYYFPECLALLLINNDLEKILGAAYPASSSPYGPRGGICESPIHIKGDGKTIQTESLNTLVVTHQNEGRQLPLGLTILVFAHEFGHSFGSVHDGERPTDDKRCIPGRYIGNYVMYPQTPNEIKTNNKLFSPCSRNAIYPVLLNKGSCFTEVPGALCGDKKVEGSEECDCGPKEYCDRYDPCCTPPGGSGGDEECKLRSTSVCSPESPCCNSTCQYVSAQTAKLCNKGSGCTLSSYCNGSSASCPTPQKLPDGTTCGNGHGICNDGRCEPIVCSTTRMMTCQCSNHTEACTICCSDGVQCRSAKYLGLSKSHVYLPPGSLCNQSRGYCSFDFECISMTDYDRINVRVADFLFNVGVMGRIHLWLINYWALLVLGAVPIMFFAAVIVVNIKSRSRVRHVAEYPSVRMDFLWQLARSHCEKLLSRNTILDKIYNEKIASLGQRRTIDETVAVARMSTFFPFASQDAIVAAVYRNRSERAAVVDMLSQGHAIRTLM